MLGSQELRSWIGVVLAGEAGGANPAFVGFQAWVP